ncbi:MAG TPA: hypothetical protein VKR61_12840 [Bryobacteraceae bacterium]|nr:hypothetical protein [Bryobacteraceae bacterium]
MSHAAYAQTAACTSFQHTVTVTISSANGAATVSQDPACVARGGKMSWTATEGDSWSADFTDDSHSPFASGKKHHGAKVAKTSGDKVKACSKSDSSYDAAAGGCVFKFKATHVKGGKSWILDPQVVVQPGT